MIFIRTDFPLHISNDPSTANKERGMTDISYSPIDNANFGTSSGRDCWIIRNLTNSCRSSLGLTTLSPKVIVHLSIHEENVLSLSFVMVSHMLILDDTRSREILTEMFLTNNLL